MKYRLQREAAADIEHADERWRAGRPAAPELFLDELGSALAQICAMPASGTMYGSDAGELVRRVLCPKTRYHVYYRVDDEGPIVLAVWSTLRGRGPRFRRARLS